MNDAEFGRWARSFRQDRGFSQRALARLMGYGPSMINDVEQGKRQASARWVKEFARVLELDVLAVSAMRGFVPEGCRPSDYDRAIRATRSLRSELRCRPRT